MQSTFDIEIKTKTSTLPTPNVNETKLNMNRKKDMCILNMDMNELKRNKKLNDDEKNDIISVEDEIYNLAFRPATKM